VLEGTLENKNEVRGSKQALEWLIYSKRCSGIVEVVPKSNVRTFRVVPNLTVSIVLNSRWCDVSVRSFGKNCKHNFRSMNFELQSVRKQARLKTVQNEGTLFVIW